MSSEIASDKGIIVMPSVSASLLRGNYCARVPSLEHHCLGEIVPLTGDGTHPPKSHRGVLEVMISTLKTIGVRSRGKSRKCPKAGRISNDSNRGSSIHPFVNQRTAGLSDRDSNRSQTNGLTFDL